MKKFKITTYRISGSKCRTTKEQHKRPLRLAVLADLHCAEYGEKNSRLIRAIYDSKPDGVMVVGDMLVSKPNQEVDLDITLSLMKALTKHYPVFYSNGNHEYRMKTHPEIYGAAYQKFKQNLLSLGVHLLENEKIAWEAAGSKYIIHGYELDNQYFSRFSRHKLPVEEINTSLGRPNEEAFHILLAHNPAFFDSYAKWGADLTLSGHLHGGMIRLPFLGGVISPQVHLFPKYDKGLFQIGPKKLIVSAGLGCHSIKLRIFNPTELVIIEID